MNKKEIVRAITYKVCEFAKSLGYIIEDDGFGGNLTFIQPGESIDNCIEWNRSYQEAVTLNWASDITKIHAQAIDNYMGPVIEWYNAQYVDKRKRVMA